MLYPILVFFVKVNFAICYYLFELVREIRKEDYDYLKQKMNSLEDECKETYGEINSEISRFIYED